MSKCESCGKEKNEKDMRGKIYIKIYDDFLPYYLGINIAWTVFIDSETRTEIH